MKFVGFVTYVVSMLSVARAFKDGSFTIDLRREGYGDILTVKDSFGSTVSICYIYESREYQIGIPNVEDEHVCLVSRYYVKEQEAPPCFKRKPAPKRHIKRNEIDLSECADREIIFLSPTDCEGSNGGENRENEVNRQKRECYKRQELVSSCITTALYCQRYGWWTGRNRCKSWGIRCARYEVRVVETEWCD